jgi:hypothetical protein
MAYILYTSSGTVLTTVQDATIDETTSLTFIGRNFSGYGQTLEENFVYLLENFNNSTPPTTPIQGQLWFDYSTQQLNVSYDGQNFKGVASLTTATNATLPVNPVLGDMVWNVSTNQLWFYNGSSYVIIGPAFSGPGSSWAFTQEQTNESIYEATIRGVIDGVNMVAFSDVNYVPAAYPNSDLGVGSANTFTVVKAGITLPGADSTYGISTDSTTTGYMLWGTASHSLASDGINITESAPSSTNLYIPLLSNVSGVSTAAASSSFYYNSGVLNATATSAYYADLAERYEADREYEPGTVLIIGGDKEVTTTTKFADTRVAGVVSTNPAYLMNKDAGNDKTHPPIALKGRVPCKVHGYIEKGDLLVTSDYAGIAVAAKSVAAGAVIGKALQSHSQGFGIIEVLVV